MGDRTFNHLTWIDSDPVNGSFAERNLVDQAILALR